MAPKPRKESLTRSVTIYRLVKAGFIAKGTSLHAYALSIGRHRQNIAAALTGEWTGPQAKKVAEAAMAAAGVSRKQAA